ncbi:PTS system mannose/fructose/sorbose family transporter subunit IID, partial [Senegalia sp. (in: firmicutes)]
MESNVNREELVVNPEYKDQRPVELDRKTLTKMAWRSLLLQASFNYERMQAAGWLYGMSPALEKIHKEKEDLSKSMKMHMEFFNTHPFLVTFVMGIVAAMEGNKNDTDTIRGIKVATMGPLGGIGDALFWLTLLPIAAGIGASLAIDG